MKYLKYNKHKLPKKSFVIETKIVRPGRKTFSWSELSLKERRILKMAKGNGVLSTNSDYSRFGTNCDGQCIRGDGYMFIMWIRKGNKTFYTIPIDLILNEISFGEKLLTEKRAEELTILTGKLK